MSKYVNSRIKEGIPTEMSEYMDSFNMIFGCSNSSIDLFNNPYVSIKLYDID